MVNERKCECGLEWGHSTKHAPAGAYRNPPEVIMKWKHSPWQMAQWMLKWSLVMFAITGSLFMVRMWLVMQESDIACKAKAFDQLQEIVLTVRQAT